MFCDGWNLWYYDWPYISKNDISIGHLYKESLKLRLMSCLLSRNSSVLLQVNITRTAEAGQCFSFSYICILHWDTRWVINYKGIQVRGRYFYIIFQIVYLMTSCCEQSLGRKNNQEREREYWNGRKKIRKKVFGLIVLSLHWITVVCLYWPDMTQLQEYP